MGATTVTLTNQFPAGGPMRLLTGTITMSNSYATGGDTCTPSQFGVKALSILLADEHNTGVLFDYDYTNQKMQAFFPTGGAAAAPTSTAAPTAAGAAGAVAVTSSAATVPVTITPGVGKEVGATTDLSAFVLRFVAYGL